MSRWLLISICVLLGIPSATPHLVPPPLLPHQVEEAAKQIVGAIPGFIRNETANLEFLNLHNKARKHKRLPPFIWDLALERFACDYAQTRRDDCNLIHSDGPYGENLFWGAGNKWTPKDAVKLWIKEHKYYNFKTNTCKQGKLCGHYTQIVWRDSCRLGCVLARCSNGDSFGVCSYDPPGNYLGELPFFHYNH